MGHDTSPRPSTTLFEDAIDVPLWLEADRNTPYEARLARDREIARQIAGASPPARVRAWWRLLQMEHKSDVGLRLSRGRQLVTVVMVLIGAGTGCAVALAAFHYDGSVPVNVVTVLAALVVAPLVLLWLTLLLIVARSLGLRAISDLLAAINPGALAATVYRRVARPPRAAAELFGWHAGRTAAAGRFSKWQFLYWAQAAAVAFGLAAIATGGVLITFTDLAFGWSTTLGVDANAVNRIVSAVALPWRAFVPSAVPDAALIEQSEFFRLAGTSQLDIHASRTLAGWWSFVILAIATYGLLPRLILLVAAKWRLVAATQALLVEDPRVTALRDRMDSPVVETAATEPEHPHLYEGIPERVRPPQNPEAGRADTGRAVIWGGSIDRQTAGAYARSHLGIALGMVVEAGGDRSLGADREALESITAANGSTLVVFTRAWEPPLLEFLDYLGALRRNLGPRQSIVVVPVPETPGALSPVEFATWAKAVGQLADPHLYVEPGAV
jgi:hypothetical protein